MYASCRSFTHAQKKCRLFRKKLPYYSLSKKLFSYFCLIFFEFFFWLFLVLNLYIYIFFSSLYVYFVRFFIRIFLTWLNLNNCRDFHFSKLGLCCIDYWTRKKFAFALWLWVELVANSRRGASRGAVCNYG